MVLLLRRIPVASLRILLVTLVASYARRRMRAFTNKGSPRSREKPEVIPSAGRFGRR